MREESLPRENWSTQNSRANSAAPQPRQGIASRLERNRTNRNADQEDELLEMPEPKARPKVILKAPPATPAQGGPKKVPNPAPATAPPAQQPPPYQAPALPETPVYNWQDFWASHAEVPRMAGMKGTDLLQCLSNPAPEQPYLIQAGHVEDTLKEHKRSLEWAKTTLEKDKEAAVVTALVDGITRAHNKENWRWSTTLKRALSLQGALALLPKYFCTTEGINLNSSPLWRQAIRKLTQLSKEESPNQPQAALVEDVEDMIASNKTSRPEKVCLALGWATCSRLGCILSLKKEDVQFLGPTTDGKAQAVMITFRRGKGVKTTGPYTVNSRMSQAWAQMVQEYMATRHTFIFPKKVKMGKAIKEASPTGKKLEQRSLRRGALQALALSGVSEETLMRYSGHTRVSTLRRYLNWNTKNQKVRLEMEDAAQALC